LEFLPEQIFIDAFIAQKSRKRERPQKSNSGSSSITSDYPGSLAPFAAQARLPYARKMTSMRHLLWFLYLGLSWGIVPILYRLLANAHMPTSHTVFLSGVGVGAILYAVDASRTRNWRISGTVLGFSVLCAMFANVPFALNLAAAAHVPPSTMAMIVSTSPLVNYAFALAAGWETATRRRLLALALGFASTLILIVPGSAKNLHLNPLWVAVAMSLPLFYCLYNNFAARKWPRGAAASQVAAVESGLGGILAMPFALAYAPFAASDGPALSAYWLIVAAVAMWVVERIAYFTLIKEKGAVYTAQASYVATPAAVIIASLMFGNDIGVSLWVSLVLLMAALWLNNAGREVAVLNAEKPAA
jgi:drug/metabolite transporter (DMT)-like permease